MKLTDKAETAVTHLIDAILGQVEGTNPNAWQRPWAQMLTATTPTNALSQKPYQGSNWMLMSLAAMEAEYTEPWWATFEQWRKLGNQVQRGEHGTVGIRPQSYNVCRECKGYVVKRCPKPGHETKTFIKWHVFTGFHIRQTEGPWEPPTVDLKPIATVEAIDAFVDRTGITVLVDPTQGPAYWPMHDQVTMPAPAQFTTTEDYYASLFHELGHATGHKARTARHEGQEARFIDQTMRGREEFVAELTSAMVAAHWGVVGETQERHAEYLANWLHYTRNTPADLLSATAKATQATDWLMQFAEAPEIVDSGV